jgi:hypothetical protein
VRRANCVMAPAKWIWSSSMAFKGGVRGGA